MSSETLTKRTVAESDDAPWGSRGSESESAGADAEGLQGGDRGDGYGAGLHQAPAYSSHGEAQEHRGVDTWPRLIVKIIVCVLCGIIFGFAMEKARVYEPRLIRYQMVMKRLIMLKMFLSAVAAGMFGMSVLAMIPGSHRQFLRTCNGYYNSLTEKGVLSSVLGGLLVGVGMVLAGSCPTSIFTQVGAMLPNSGYTFAGALFGTLLYGLLKPVLDSFLKPGIQESSNPWSSSPYFIMALPLVAMFGILVCALEILIPWTIDIKMKSPDAPLLSRKAWPPYYSGMIIGGLQVPLILFIGETLGGSSSFLTMVSQVFVGPVKRLSPFIAKYRTGFPSWWQVFYVGGIIYGAYLSASWSGYLGVARGVPPTEAFLGGTIMILGARIAGGCTSGHGISGMGFLSILSFITVACMFMGAMTTAYIMQHYRLLKV